MRITPFMFNCRFYMAKRPLRQDAAASIAFWRTATPKTGHLPPESLQRFGGESFAHQGVFLVGGISTGSGGFSRFSFTFNPLGSVRNPRRGFVTEPRGRQAPQGAAVPLCDGRRRIEIDHRGIIERRSAMGDLCSLTYHFFRLSLLMAPHISFLTWNRSPCALSVKLRVGHCG